MVIPSNWPDVELLTLGILRPLLPGVTVAVQKPDATPPYKQVLISAEYGRKETAISRSCILNIEGWSVRESGAENATDSRNLVSTAMRAIEEAVATSSWLLEAEVGIGPNRAQDAIGDPEFSEGTVNLSVLRTA